MRRHDDGEVPCPEFHSSGRDGDRGFGNAGCMKRDTPPRTPSNADDEIASLITTLLVTERRLEELTGGEVDTVSDGDGRTIVLRRAQSEMRHSEAANHAALDREMQRQQTELRVLFDLMPELIWFKDTKNRILRVNQRVAEMAGLAVADMEGKQTHEVHPDEAAKYYADDLEVINSGVRKLGIVEKITKVDGKVLWMLTDRVPVLDKTGKVIGIVVMSRDITERKRAEEAIRESEERFAAAFEHAPIGKALVSPDGHWLKVNRVLCDLFGYSEEEFLVRTTMDLTHPDEIALDLDHAERTIDGDVRSLQFEKRFVHKRGTIIVALLNISLIRKGDGQPRYFVCQIQDITERDQTEERLRVQSAALNAAGDAILIADRDFRIVWINPAFTELTGYSNQESIGRDPRDLIRSHVHDEQFYRELADKVHAGESWRGEMTNRRKDGSLYLEYQTITPVKDDDGTIQYFISIKTDLTARKQMEGQLRQAQKMEAVGQLAAGVAHEFNNLLQALMSMSALMRFRAPTPEIATIGTDMESLIKRGAGLTQQLLIFSRRRPLERLDLDLGDEVQKASVLLRHLIPETITVVVEVSSERLNIQGDAGQIQQVLLNLAINARDAMSAGGVLTLRTGRDGAEVFHEVEDTGHGMDEATQAHLFEPFFTTKEPGKGTGLGLAVAHGIIEQHGGRITVHSRLGEGSRFRVILPEAQDARIRAAEPIADVKVQSGSGRVLLVEDDAAVRAGISVLLDLLGYEVTSVASGEEALALVMNSPPEILLSDVTLPGMTGPEMVERMRARWPGLPVVLMSGYFDEKMQASAARDRWHFLQKPFELTDLARELEKVRDRNMVGSVVRAVS